MYPTGSAGIISGVDINEPEFNAAVATVLNMEKTGLKITLPELAEATGIPKVTLQRYLAGSRAMNMAQVRSIAAALDLTSAEVYALAEERVERERQRALRQLERREGVSPDADVSDAG
jgi:cyanate lyase